MLTWGHLYEDGVTVLGLIDFYCVGVMRRRWPGWKLAELAKRLHGSQTEAEKHKRWR